ncbi:hypothetical protein EPI10_034419 [Gossypium australe]|uniref:Uncharacterized protein n=1 Tax=Gossypium australe TaxID=47621 RepID=A0A5B6U8L9_9ROSI|nr:hypothetical protein EPI10_034419 [Gossypium australe]
MTLFWRLKLKSKTTSFYNPYLSQNFSKKIILALSKKKSEILLFFSEINPKTGLGSSSRSRRRCRRSRWPEKKKKKNTLLDPFFTLNPDLKSKSPKNLPKIKKRQGNSSVSSSPIARKVLGRSIERTLLFWCNAAKPWEMGALRRHVGGSKRVRRTWGVRVRQKSDWEQRTINI